MECAPLAVRLTKQAALQNHHRSLPEALRAEPPLTPLWRDSHDTREGPLAFAEKRKPTWLGR
jgi:enoyl-CoA hydratase/carnithine racemase